MSSSRVEIFAFFSDILQAPEIGPVAELVNAGLMKRAGQINSNLSYNYMC